jgi:ribosome biogenesis GTPase
MFEVAADTYVIDTPGIKELGLWDIGDEELSHYFPEMRKYIGQCRFNNCTHIHEPNCAFRAAMETGEIAPSRYENYLSMLADDDNRR